MYFCGTWLDAGVLVGTVLCWVGASYQLLLLETGALQKSSAQLLGLISDTFSFQNGTKILIKSFELVNQPVDSNHPGLHQSLARDQALSSNGQKSVCCCVWRWSPLLQWSDNTSLELDDFWQGPTVAEGSGLGAYCYAMLSGCWDRYYQVGWFKKLHSCSVVCDRLTNMSHDYFISDRMQTLPWWDVLAILPSKIFPQNLFWFGLKYFQLCLVILLKMANLHMWYDLYISC